MIESLLVHFRLILWNLVIFIEYELLDALVSIQFIHILDLDMLRFKFHVDRDLMHFVLNELLKPLFDLLLLV